MKNTFRDTLKVLILALMVFGAMAGCETTDSGGASSSSVYYGVGFVDPWYYGDYDDYDEIVVVPPDGRPDSGPRPEHPIARPPPSAVRPMPQPSIPSMPRASFRR